MRAIFRYIVLAIAVLIYVISSDDGLTKRLSFYKLQNNSFLTSDRFKYGDLYGMSYLPDFRILRDLNSIKQYAHCNCPEKINLYVVSDSYIWPIFDRKEYYCGVNKLVNIKTNDRDVIRGKLDPSKKNILLIEFSERNLRPLLGDTTYDNDIIAGR